MDGKPTLQEIKHFLNSSNLYTLTAKTNDTRKQQILFLRKPTTQNTITSKILLGATTYIAETIRKTYKYLSPFYQGGYLPFGGSRLYTNIENQLAKWNQEADDWRFINVMQFYLYIQSLSAQNVAELFYSTKESLLLNIENRLIRIRKRENTRVAVLTNSLPDLELFQKRIPRLISEYKDSLNNRKWCDYNNPNRLRLLEFNDFIIKTWYSYREQLQKSYENLSEEEKIKKQKKDYEDARDILTGAILYILLRIKHEYVALSPERSALFNKCLKLIGLKSLNDMSAENKEKKLRALAYYLQQIKTDERYATQVNQAQNIFDLDKYILKIDEYIVSEEKKKNTTRASKHITSGLSYCVQYGLSYALTAVGGSIITGATGGLGAVVYGAYTAAGTVLVSMIGQIFYDNYLPPAVSGMYTYMLQKIGNGIATITVGAADKTFCALYNHQDLKKSDRDFLKEWIHSLLLAPASVVAEEEKEQIRYVIGAELLNNLEEKVPITTFTKR